MKSELIIDVNGKRGESTVALLEDGQLMEYRTQKQDAGFSMGDIYVGVVHKVMQNHNAAFVDIGSKREGFLHYKDLGPQLAFMLERVKQVVRRGGKAQGRPGEDMLKLFTPPPTDGGGPAKGEQGRPPKEGKITDVMKNNDLIMVQVAREAYSSKGPSLTTEISIAGRNIVLLPFGSSVMVSSKITSRVEVVRLRRLVSSILPEGFGAIVRTAAEGKKVETLVDEMEVLVGRWRQCLETLQTSPSFPACLLSELNRSTALLRDNLNGSYSSIQVNDKEVYEEIKTYMASIAPGAENIVKYYSSSKVPIFDQFDVSKQVRRLLGRTVMFHKGSYLIIQSPEAFHVIDVNSGSGSRKAETPEETAYEVNLAACTEVARQMRLRDLGGIIVIDFIDMAKAEHRKSIYDTMVQLMKNDKVTHRVLPLTDFGLMQITRQRHGPENDIDTSEVCPCCNGTGKIDNSILLIDQIEQKLSVIAEKKLYKALELRVHPFIEAYLTIGLRSRRAKLVRKYGCKLKVRAMSTYSILEFEFYDPKGAQVML